MNGCTINSKDHCRESGAHGVAKTYYLHKLLYQNIRSFLLDDILVILMKNILVRSTTSCRTLSSRTKPGVSTPRRKRAFLCHREKPTSLSSLSSLPPSFEERPPTPALVSFPHASRALPLIFLSLLYIPSTIPPVIMESYTVIPIEKTKRTNPRYVHKLLAKPPWRFEH